MNPVDELLMFVKHHVKVYLYGAGVVTKFLIEGVLRPNEIDNVQAVIVSDGHKTSESFIDYKVLELSQVQFSEGDGIVICVSKHREELRTQLTEGHIPKYVDFYEERIWEALKFYDGATYIDSYFNDFSFLNYLGVKYETDKAEKFNNYLRKYEFFLNKYKDEDILLVELGVYKGASIMMWADYLKNGRVLGVDINASCLNIKGDNYECLQRDLSEQSSLQEISSFAPTIVIDDASHIWSHQIMALANIFPKLQSGGCYIVEDIGTSFGIYKDLYYNDASISAYDFLVAVCEFVAGNESVTLDTTWENKAKEIAAQVSMITFIKGSCIIIKR